MARWGHPDIPAEIRFFKHVLKQESGCWEWMASKSHNGYGLFHRNTKSRKHEMAHRASWEMFVSNIPPEMLVLHKCDNRKCVNPEHLFLGSAADNTHDMMGKWRTNSRLTPEQVEQIRVHPGKYRDIASEFGLKSHKSVSNIKRGKTFPKAILNA